MLLEAIFEDLKPTEGILVFSPRPHKRVLVHSVPEALELAAVLDTQGSDAYYGVAPRSLTDVEEVTRVPVVWLDVDLKDLEQGEASFEQLCKSVAIPPTYKIFSGHGYHLYWKLEHEIPADAAGQLMKALWQAYGSGAGGRTYNAKWLLRVPGTHNYKDPMHPIPVVERDANELAVYKASDVLALTSLSKTAARGLWQSGSQGQKSRSEKDFWVISQLLSAGVSDAGIATLYQMLPVGDRYAERGREDYLERTIEAVRIRERTDVPSTSTQFVEKDGVLCFRTSKGLVPIATFVFKPQKLIKVADDIGEDQLLGDIVAYGHTWEGEILPKSAFNNANALAKRLKIASWQWTGGDREVRAWLPYLMDQLYAADLPHARGVSAIGRHGDHWVYPGGCFNTQHVYTKDEAPYVYLPTGREVPAVEYTFPDEFTYTQHIQNITPLIPCINRIETIAPIIGWFCACPLKTLFEEVGVRFPHLNIYGTQGSGKSSTVLYICQRLMGWQAPRAYPSKTRLFVMLSLMASSNAVPISFGEFRDSSSFAQEDFLDLIRRAYDVGRDSRGRPDQTTQTYDLSAPMSVDGEDAFSDPAVRERSVVVHMTLDACREDSSTYAAFQELVRLDLPQFAGKFIQRTLRETATSVRHMFDLSLADLRMILPQNMPDRVRRNLAVVMCGLKLYNSHVKLYGGTTLELSTQAWRWLLEDTLLSAASGRTRLLVDDFVEDVVAYAMQVPHTPQFLLKYNVSENILWFHLTAAVGWWAQKRRREGRVLLQIQAIRAQFRELERSYACPERLVETGSGLQRLVGVNIAKAEAEGLDIPQRLRPFSEVIINVS